ncbi:hypothetical protein GGR32_000101 [Mesonia hippocampi]|uniref:Uncharacterized protein n=1 Tax=Mesonia hippocampi TaxID=1628250 RepID=A0A840EHC8_9FLAO|nr:hypothetical protein [Mesonia hippocampi]MBB4117829.1 hypothetical protein [Mesonia hippocampi]
MNNPQAQQLIRKILGDLNHTGIITNTLMDDLKKLRPYAVEEKQPVIAKALRLAFEHIEEYDSFNIPIPEDEPLEEIDFTPADFDPTESMVYLITLIRDINNKLNIEELRDYNNAFVKYAEEH